MHALSRSLISRRATVGAENKPNPDKTLAVSRRKGMNPSLHSSLPPMHIANDIQLLTQEREKNLAWMHHIGSDVLHKGQAGSMPASIVDVNMNQYLQPIYSLRLIDGQEIETDHDHIAAEPLFSRSNTSDSREIV